MNYLALANFLYNRADIVCWPPYASGNALMKCLTVHDAYIYNPDWNMWGPLEYVLQPPATFTESEFKSHYADIFGEVWLDLDQPIFNQLADALKRKGITNSEETWIYKLTKEDKRMVFGPMHHISSKQMLSLTTRPIVQLIPKDYSLMSTRQDLENAHHKSSKEWLRSKSKKWKEHFECIDHPQILNIYTEDFFYSTFEVFMREYTKLRKHFDLEDRSEQVWAFVLYYQDRVNKTKPAR
jgi:hypothetical protein